MVQKHLNEGACAGTHVVKPPAPEGLPGAGLSVPDRHSEPHKQSGLRSGAEREHYEQQGEQRGSVHHHQRCRLEEGGNLLKKDKLGAFLYFLNYRHIQQTPLSPANRLSSAALYPGRLLTRIV